MSTSVYADVDTVVVYRPLQPSVEPYESERFRSTELRLTRRGRLVVVMAVIALALGALTMLGAPAASTAHVHHPTAHTVVVEPGETLWDIASTVAPGQDPRELVAEIVDLNSLTDPGAIRAGQSLYVPAK
jgi:LysM repeat protein